MAGKQYDLIVIGSGLSEQIAAALMVKKGYQVLRLATEDQAWTQPLACCAALDKLLKILGGKPLPYYKTDSFQLITSRIRLEFGGELPLVEELRREIPDHLETVLSLLTRLDQWGHKLNLLITGHAPGRFSSQQLLAFYWRQLRQQLPFLQLQRSIETLTGTIASSATRQTLLQLFYGLSLVTPTGLSCAEVALKWHTATRPNHVASGDLIRLLEDCYASTGGQHIPEQELREIHYKSSRLDGISTCQGRHFKARQYLIGPLSGPVQAPEVLADILQPPSPRGLQRWVLAGLPSQRPPMLASQIIVAGRSTLRLSWPQNCSTGKPVLVETASETMTTDAESVRRQLVPLLPFIKFKLTEVKPASSQQDSQVRSWPRRAMPEPIAPNALLCHGGSLLPSVGLNADVMLGQAAAGILQHRLG